MKRIHSLIATAACALLVCGCSRAPVATPSQSPPRVALAQASAARPAPAPVRFVPTARGLDGRALRLDDRARRKALALAPRGASTEFFGVASGRVEGVGEAGRDLLAHFYSVPVDRKAGLFSLFLDVWTRAASGSLRRLSRADLTAMPCLNGNWARGGDTISRADLMWLDSARRVPVLKVEMSGTSMSGWVGCRGLLVFARGLGAKPTLQSFEVDEQMLFGIKVWFPGRDARGFLQVRQDEVSYEQGFENEKIVETLSRRTLFSWDGQKFTAPSGR